ncbi:MAG: hypothetical protein AVDCRST_MAG31-898 [uncultured Sphingomonas sp.]|uniref:General stress protein 17M-like domain-containing protein n=1 Tax=uncultured Sphingomonas sp. TaxID=158754 RepID=A0A6J4T267_9SPHN|nr:hypothetical protein [uncultured Sphingomonas sp.]CAA9511112.1 MAG: hypothetical protein AVDCRST_MAG31-898 [uncultured Sphingomonas sp.]
MQGRVASAVFDNYNEAERAIGELRSAGVRDSAISVIGRHEGTTTETTGSGEKVGNSDEPASLISRVAAGSGIGALLGVAALAIPGVGPLAAAGAIAETAIGGAALTGTAVGAAAGGLSDILGKHGVSDEDSKYYGDRINNGGIFVSVDTSDGGVSQDQIQDILFRAGGHNAGRARTGSSSY